MEFQKKSKRKNSSGKYVPTRSDLTTESAEETQKPTEKKKKKKGSERALTRISRKTRKAAKDLKYF